MGGRSLLGNAPLPAYSTTSVPPDGKAENSLSGVLRRSLWRLIFVTETAHLLIFTRYPEAGRTKTRLIPTLGAEGAADLQRQMTEHTVAQVKPLLSDAPPADAGINGINWQICLWFGGGTIAQMQDWLGKDWAYFPQSEGDLGDRLQTSVQYSFNQGAAGVVVIGIDCPNIDATTIRTAWDQLQTHEVVLGPATDGGYYLIGMKRLIPDLFQGITWGTERVFAQTEAIAQRLHLSTAVLSPLQDVDYPEDLPVWEAARRRVIESAPPAPTISVILPVLNEAAIITQTLKRIQQQGFQDCIVVDGGSTDATIAQAKATGATVISSVPGRAKQMNAGANHATGDILLFLHGDTQLPDHCQTAIIQAFRNPAVVAGAFELSIESDRPGIRWIEAGVKWRSHHLKLPYGDQAIFLKASTFRRIGGFPDLPIMEDVALVRHLQRLGDITILPQAVLTSGRRWERLGVLKTTLVNQLMLLGFAIGISPQRLARWYRGK
jgi:rSAM/selenodomain-associated transferase 2/rSAM/selenodomain-associated transferase 1